MILMEGESRSLWVIASLICSPKQAQKAWFSSLVEGKIGCEMHRNILVESVHHNDANVRGDTIKLGWMDLPFQRVTGNVIE